MRIAPRREGIGLIVLDEIDLRHGKIGICGQIANDGVIFRCVRLIDLDRVVHVQHHLVGIPVAEQIHARGYDKGDHHAAGSADEKTDAHEQGGHKGKQHSGAHHIHGISPPALEKSIKFIPFIGRLPLYDGVLYSKLQ